MARLLTIFCVLAVLALASKESEAAVYTVGDSAGWDISADLPSWSASKIFHIGDALLFQYSSYHTLNMVDRDGFDRCNASNARLTGTDGNTTVPLTTSGEKYFICGFMSHCLGGMKLQINVERSQMVAPAGAPQFPEAPPPLVQRPTSDDNPPPGAVSIGVLHDARRSMFVGWLCTIGALIWIGATVGV